ncbi:hypothetical protein BGW36DRAFT_424108 [Talaromyces proteolyticus]|uniref:Transcription factor domain-containing protein n=1 Tax=Talaromyces proteolyticus TaxID=1131652 RepID=A0AAD4L235_9EURO|nr:uncharacterized protein BGW36DRAFT_424108 [Talaromyces proteolyticus]KAH8701804.1 hypothetical protein BGW36DRAFT_424108 [Talaromyces proteolyticus]
MAIIEPIGLSREQDRKMLPLATPLFLSSSPIPYLKINPQEYMKKPQLRESSARPINVSSVPRHVVDALLRHYCEIYRPQYPGIEEADLYAACDRVYNNKQPSDADVFYVHITLAISTNTLMHQNEVQAITVTIGFRKTAIAHLPQVGLSNPWERLQALQLLTHYGFLNPMDVDCCKCAEAATRLCLYIGLHHELPASIQANLDSATLNTRRRLFWHSYSIDSAGHTARCRPFLLPMSTITAKFPDFQSELSPTHHMWLLRQIESEITGTLYWPSHQFDKSHSSFDQWFATIHRRLIEWYNMVLQSIKLTETIEFYELHYHIQILRLNRPSPRCPNPTKEMCKKALTSSAALIRQFNMIEQMGKLFNLWHAAHFTIESGVCLLASILTGIEHTQQGQTHLAGDDIAILSRYIKTFSFLLGRISRRWPEIAEYTPVLDDICIRTLNALEQQSVGPGVDNTEDFLTLKQTINNLTLFPVLPWNSQQPSVDANIASRTIRNQTTEEISVPQPVGLSSEAEYAGMTTDEMYLVPAQNFEDPFLSHSFPYNAPGSDISPTDLAPINSTWLDSQLDTVQSSLTSADLYGLGALEPWTWDFAGMNSEQIIAELLDAGNNELLMTGVGDL